MQLFQYSKESQRAGLMSLPLKYIDPGLLTPQKEFPKILRFHHARGDLEIQSNDSSYGCIKATQVHLR